jgi:hypothetical protein
VLLVSPGAALTHRVRLHERAVHGTDVSLPYTRLLARAVEHVPGKLLGLDAEHGTLDVERSEASCRKLLQRAREQLVDAQLQPPSAAAEQEAVSDAFFEALASGDLQGLIEVFAQGASMRADHGGKASAARRVIAGPNHIARFLHGLWKKRDQLPAELQILPRYVNGAPGIVMVIGGRVQRDQLAH